MKKKKLQLNKKIVTNLSNLQKAQIVGGNAFTTSIFSCTGFTCCDGSGETSGGETCATCDDTCAGKHTCHTCEDTCPGSTCAGDTCVSCQTCEPHICL